MTRERWEIEDAEASWKLAWVWIKAGDRTVKDVTLRDIAYYHRQRNKLWHAGAQPWTGADWGNAAAGEMGEACNVIKKLRRIELGMTGNQLRNQSTNVQELVDKLRGELGGTIIYILSICDHYGIDLTDAIRDEFNKVSDEQGLDVKIPTQPEVDPIEKAARALAPLNPGEPEAGVYVSLKEWSALQLALARAQPGDGRVRD